MTIAHYEDLPQGTYLNKPQFVGEKLLATRFVARDPLTGRAYFDTRDLTSVYKALQSFQDRVQSRKPRDFVELKVHADLITAKAVRAVTGLSPHMNGGGGIRGTIRGFSRQSRKRMIEFMAKARIRGQLLFSTFTYPDKFPVGNESQWIADFEALRRRIERRFPQWSIVWRKELKERLSGENKGKLAPHYHMIIDTGIEATPNITVEQAVSYGTVHTKTTSSASRLFESWALGAWSEIVGSNDPKHREHGNFTVACRNRRHAYKYISKYVAKEEDDEFEVGRRWGRIGAWDTSHSSVVMLTRQEFIELKRLVRRWLKNKATHYAKYIASSPTEKGMTIFGLGDMARNGDFYERLLNHVADLAGTIRPFGELENSNGLHPL